MKHKATGSRTGGCMLNAVYYTAIWLTADHAQARLPALHSKNAHDKREYRDSRQCHLVTKHELTNQLFEITSARWNIWNVTIHLFLPD